MMPLAVTINGAPQTFDRALTVAEMIQEVRGDAATTGVAVAVNDTVVPRQRWADAALANGDRIEIITAVQGG